MAEHFGWQESEAAGLPVANRPGRIIRVDPLSPHNAVSSADIVHGVGLFLVAGVDWLHGAGILAASTNGVDWGLVDISRDIAGTSLTAISQGAGLFLAVGDSGNILASPDGTNWTQRVSGTTRNLSSVAYGNGMFVVVEESGVVLTSPDGVTWFGCQARQHEGVGDAGSDLFVEG